MLRIGEFSKLTKITIKALRYYDKLGILKPAFVDGETFYRYYTEEQIKHAQQIQLYKTLGLSCRDISAVMNDGADIKHLLFLRKKELERQKNIISNSIEAIERIINDHHSQVYSPCLKEIGGCRVYCSRSFISDISQIRDFILYTMQVLKRTNPDVKLPDPDYCCVIYSGDSYRKNDIFIEYIQSVDRWGTDNDIIKFKSLEPVTAVSVVHRGSYENLRDAYLSAVEYVLANGYEICGDARERYIDGVWNCATEADWKTEVQIPVKLTTLSEDEK